jgi:hypothetical protein
LFYGGATPSQSAREKGRDRWKDLDLADQGIPQGSSFGPMLASTIAAYHLRGIPNLLMYVDDGMVFLPKGAPSPEKEIIKALKPIKVELAFEKSGIRERSSLLTEGIKFLGTRSYVKSFTTMISQTRRGISKPFPEASSENYLRLINTMYAEKMVTFSKFKQLKWFFMYEKSRLKEFLDGQTLHVAMKWGFFGNLLAEAYNPANSSEDMKQKIKEGMDQAQTEIMRNKLSYGYYVMNINSKNGHNSFAYKSSTGEWSSVKPDIYNASTLAIDLLLELGINNLLKRKASNSLTKVGTSYAHKPKEMEFEWVERTYYIGNTEYKCKALTLRKKEQ